MSRLPVRIIRYPSLATAIARALAIDPTLTRGDIDSPDDALVILVPW
jgi:hypothetical protein